MRTELTLGIECKSVCVCCDLYIIFGLSFQIKQSFFCDRMLWLRYWFHIQSKLEI